ncbi:MAG: hypothetical protein P1U63_12585 [Coxiellaceae bacterium]|nr:hypothetical protein [Coxiellaceae bacterium]
MSRAVAPHPPQGDNILAKDIFRYSITGSTTATLFLSAKIIANYWLNEEIPNPVKKAVNALGVGGLVYLVGNIYGVLNDIRAVGQCPEYFTIGHTGMHKRILRTDNRMANAIVWGLWATTKLSYLFSLIVTPMELTLNYTNCPVENVDIFAASALIGVLGSLMAGEIAASISMRNWKAPEKQTELDARFDSKTYQVFSRPINAFICCGTVSNFESVNLSLVPHDKRAAYFATGARNSTGYICMPILAFAFMVSRIVVRTYAQQKDDFADSDFLNLTRF